MFGGPPFGQKIGGNVNLSTGSSSSFASLLDNVRAERQQREQHERADKAARVLQRRWRAGREGRRVRRGIFSAEAGAQDEAMRVVTGHDREGGVNGQRGKDEGLRVLTELVSRVVLSARWKGDEDRRMRGEWARRAVVDGARIDDAGVPVLLEPIGTHTAHTASPQPPVQVQTSNNHGVLIAIVLLAAMDSLSDPGIDASELSKVLGAAETILDRRHFAALGTDGVRALGDMVDVLSRNGWVESAVRMMQALIATNTPKKKNASLLPLTRLVLAPLTLWLSMSGSVPVSSSSTSTSTAAPPPAVLDPLLTHLLTIPSLPSSIPIPALTYLSDKLNLFGVLLPYAAAHPAVLSGRHAEGDRRSFSPLPSPLADEYGKTYLLANLATFGITGQLLGRASAHGKKSWVAVLSHLLAGLQEGWGRWVEGIVDEEQEQISAPSGMADSDDEEDEEPVRSRAPLGTAGSSATDAVIPAPSNLRPRQTRPLLPPKISCKLLLIPSAAHIASLVEMITSPSSKASTADLLALTGLMADLLRVFRGTPKWEAILDALLQGKAGKQLFKRIWRECVRGRWADSSAQGTWERFKANPHAPPLRLLSYIFNHFLLLAPDDEFFDPTYNPMSMDELLELSVIWRDLAFWGYMAGVSTTRGGQPVPNLGSASAGVTDLRGSEEDRALFTRGVTRLTERNARRQFAPADHWPMPGLKDLSGFVEAAVLEDARLFNPEEADDGEDDLMVNDHQGRGGVRRRLAARQRFSKRQVAFMSPRLGLLNNLPMSVPFMMRLKVFDQLVKADAQRIGADMPTRRSRYFNRATIRRDKLAEDGFRTLNPLGPYLKGQVQISFINSFGEEEAGIDGGGLFKEFLTNLSRDAFDVNKGLWLFTDQNELYPNPHTYSLGQHQLNWYTFLGRILGKAIYDGILVDVSFADFFLAKWLGRQSYLDDLASLDRDLYNGLIMLKNYPNPEELALTFTVAEQEFDVPRTIELVPGGSDIAVTAENRQEYIQLVCRYKLDRRISLQSRAFFDGLSEIVDVKWLRMFDQHELRQVIGGEETPIDVDDLRAHTSITGFAHDDTVKLFWRVVKKFSQQEKRALLKFVTSCERPPLLGFGHLNPSFGIRSTGNDTTRLPSASSCFNLLKLPEYKDEKTLKAKLLQAITSGAGFDLS